ncbi:putative reverse transcriptase domain, zinc finger, CCHC-type, retrotransposon gag domain protein [Tanacetum coccineum]
MSDDDANGAESPPREVFGCGLYIQGPGETSRILLDRLSIRLRLMGPVLDEFYSISKTAAIRNKIKSFRQIPSEQFHEAFNRLKELLRTCPHHDIPKWELVKVFYDGLDKIKGEKKAALLKH